MDHSHITAAPDRGGGVDGGKVNKASAWIRWEGVGLTKVSADPLKKLMVKA